MQQANHNGFDDSRESISSSIDDAPRQASPQQGRNQNEKGTGTILYPPDMKLESNDLAKLKINVDIEYTHDFSREELKKKRINAAKPYTSGVAGLYDSVSVFPESFRNSFGSSGVVMPPPPEGLSSSQLEQKAASVAILSAARNVFDDKNNSTSSNHNPYGSTTTSSGGEQRRSRKSRSSFDRNNLDGGKFLSDQAMEKMIGDRYRNMTRGLSPQHDNRSNSNRNSPLLLRPEDILRVDDNANEINIDREESLMNIHGGFSSWTIVELNSYATENSNGNDEYVSPIPRRRYACKSIGITKATGITMAFIRAASRLAYEARVLSCLDHPNIAGIQALHADGINAFRFEESSTSFFYLTEHIVVETLERRIARWKSSQQQFWSNGIVDGGGSSNTNSKERISKGMDDAASQSSLSTFAFAGSDYHGETHTEYNTSNTLYGATTDQSKSSFRESLSIEELAFHRNIEKLIICQELASALGHIHSHQIVMRNLSPKTIGFVRKRNTNDNNNRISLHQSAASTTTLQLFEFGSSRCLSSSTDNDVDIDSIDSVENALLSNATNITAMNKTTPTIIETGSLPPKARVASCCPRYVSPEMCLGLPYDCASDIYSYAMVGWEIWSHQAPYGNLSPSMHLDFVCKRGHRPIEQIVPEVVGHSSSSLQTSSNSATVSSRVSSLSTIPNQQRIFTGFEEWMASSVGHKSNNANATTIISGIGHRTFAGDSNCSIHFTEKKNVTEMICETEAPGVTQRVPNNYNSSTTPTNISRIFVMGPPATVPTEVKTLLSQAWRAKPKTRIRWPNILAQLALLRRLEELKLENHAQAVLLSRLGNLQVVQHKRPHSEDPMDNRANYDPQK